MPVIRITEFDTWRPGYANALVTAYRAGTSTKASIFADEALTVAADNPQYLLDREVSGVLYGKFAVPLYTEQAYYLDVDSSDQTGIARPGLTTLDAQDASNAVVTPTGATRSRQIDDLLGQTIWAADDGAFGSAVATATNTTTLSTAIGRASANGGGRVRLPPGAAAVTTFSLPAGVILCGEGRGITTLQSQSAARVVTITGDKAGFEDMTLDGVALAAGSTGIYAKAIDETHFHNFEIKRFESGLHCKGGQRADWQDFYISNCGSGAKLHGDNGVGDGGSGDQFRHNRWNGGLVNLCTTVGVELKYVDKKCFHNSIHDVGFDTNTGTALKIYGARHTNLDGSWFNGNTVNMTVQDGDDASLSAENTVVGLKMKGGSFQGGTATFTGTCQDIEFTGVEINDVDFTLTNPTNNLLFRDCIEDSLVTIAGDGTKFTRSRSSNADLPASFVRTTDATATVTWKYPLASGQRVSLRAVVIGNKRNANEYGLYHIAQFAHRPVATLAYDGQTANFTAGDIITGGTSGATALAVADSDSGASGTLSLAEVSGTFQNNETITGAISGSALVNGTITQPDAALLGSITSLQTAVEITAGWDAVFSVNAGDVQVTVTGAASSTIDWTTAVQVVSS